MTAALVSAAVRLRLATWVLAALGMIAVIVMVGALFPSVGGSIGRLDVPESVRALLGGADYGTIRGWMRSEIGAVYGPLVVAAIAIAAGAGATAGEEEDGVLGLILAYPVDRSRFVVAKALAVAVGVLLVSLGTFAGMVAGVAIGGGGVGVGEIVALAVHLAGFGFAVGALALALGAASGRRSVAVGGAAAVTLLGFLVNGFAPFLAGAHWLRYGSFFHFYAGHDPLANGIDPGDLAVLAAAATVLTGIAVAAFSRRDLRA